MNSKTLQRRLRGYTQSKMRAGNEDGSDVDMIDDLQSITDEDDHSIDTSYDTDDVVDAMYLPNPAIVEEMAVVLNPEAEVTNADTALKLLSDSNEALRRLDIIRMNVNYPVSGYRTSALTVLKAEPALEGMLPNMSMTKRQLSYSIENVGKKVLVAAIAAIIAALSAVIFKAIARLRKSRQVKPPTPEELEAAKAARAGQDKDKIEAYYNTVVWGQSSKHALATIMDIPATQARAELILEISKKIGDELDTLTKATVALEKFADGGAFNSDIVRYSVDSEPREIYALVNKLEDDWEKLPTHDATKPALTQDEYMNAVAALQVKVPDFNTPEFEKTSANVARLKDKLETLRKQVDKAKVDDGATLSELSRLRKGVSNIGRLAMDLAGAYRAADEQAFAISKLYMSVRLYNTHASKVTGSYKKGE